MDGALLADGRRAAATHQVRPLRVDVVFLQHTYAPQVKKKHRRKERQYGKGTCFCIKSHISPKQGKQAKRDFACTIISVYKFELTRDRLRSFVYLLVCSCVCSFVRSFDNHGNVLLPQFTRHSLVIFRPRTFYLCTA